MARHQTVHQTSHDSYTRQQNEVSDEPRAGEEPRQDAHRFGPAIDFSLRCNQMDLFPQATAVRQFPGTHIQSS